MVVVGWVFRHQLGFLCPRQLPSPVPLVLPLQPTVPPLLPVLEEGGPLEPDVVPVELEVVLPEVELPVLVDDDALEPEEELPELDVLVLVPEVELLPVLDEVVPLEELPPVTVVAPALLVPDAAVPAVELPAFVSELDTPLPEAEADCFVASI